MLHPRKLLGLPIVIAFLMLAGNGWAEGPITIECGHQAILNTPITAQGEGEAQGNPMSGVDGKAKAAAYRDCAAKLGDDSGNPVGSDSLQCGTCPDQSNCTEFWHAEVDPHISYGAAQCTRSFFSFTPPSVEWTCTVSCWKNAVATLTCATCKFCTDQSSVQIKGDN